MIDMFFAVPLFVVVVEIATDFARVVIAGLKKLIDDINAMRPPGTLCTS